MADELVYPCNQKERERKHAAPRHAVPVSYRRSKNLLATPQISKTGGEGVRLPSDENEERANTWAVARIPCWYDSYLNKLAISYTEIRLLVFILFDCRDIWNSPVPLVIHTPASRPARFLQTPQGG